MSETFWSKSKRILHKIEMFLYFFSLVLLFFSYFAAYVNPEYFVYFSFLGLAYPILLFINILFLIYWTIRLRNYALLSLGIILIGFFNLNKTFAFQFSKEKESKTKQFKILSYNVRLFNLYQWANDKNAKRQMFDFLLKQQADIICLQEFYSDEKELVSNLKKIQLFPFIKYSHIEYAQKNNKIFNYGIATFSNFPMINKGVIKINKSRNIGIYSDIKVIDDTIRVYNFHLASIHLGKEDYNFIESFTEKTELQNLKGLTGIFIKLKSGFSRRAREAEILTNHIKSSPYKVIICGDFNDTPVSFTYKIIRADLKDSFIESGSGIGNTYVYRIPLFRIDYILHSKELSSSDFKIFDIDYSDHYPISCNMKIE